MTGLVSVIDAMPLCGLPDPEKHLPRHREPRSGMAIQYQRLDCFVGGGLLAMTRHKT
jgi:hypothetical protein